MPASLAYVICFMLGVWSGMAYLRASRLDRPDRLVRTIAALRAELAETRQGALAEWLQEGPGRVAPYGINPYTWEPFAAPLEDES